MNPGRLCDVRTYLPDQSEGRSDPGQPALSLATLAGLGLANAACVAGGLALGHFLDGWWGTAPVMVLVGMAVGLLLGVVGSVLEIRRYLQD
jgi:F0F1-type ATP synthase assembly protein I